MTALIALSTITAAAADTLAGGTKKWSCPPLNQQIAASVTTIRKPVFYDQRFGERTLNRLANPKGKTPPKHIRTLGLTTFGHKITYQIKTIISSPEGYTFVDNLSDRSMRDVQTAQARATASNNSTQKYCARISGADIKIQMTELVVHILKNYHKRSCQYNSILEHENLHVKIFEKGIANLEETLIQKAATMIKNLSPGYGPTPAAASQNAFNNFKLNLKRLTTPIEKNTVRKNQRLDTRHSYRRLLKTCRNWHP